MLRLLHGDGVSGRAAATAGGLDLEDGREELLSQLCLDSFHISLVVPSVGEGAAGEVPFGDGISVEAIRTGCLRQSGDRGEGQVFSRQGLEPGERQGVAAD